MFFDSTYGYIELNQCERPGSIGDSLAETGRYITLAYVIGDNPQINLAPFVTDIGLLRHPDSPWRENDISSDQASPFLAAANLTQPSLADITISRIKKAGWKTGNGDYVSTGLLANIKRIEGSKIQWLYDLSFLGQAIIFKLPFRWSDSKKWFERSSGSSSDYLNFINGLLFAKVKNKFTWPCKIALKMVGKDTIIEKIHEYYKPEPNSQWLLDVYKKALEKL
jgi:hypothetical protein